MLLRKPDLRGGYYAECSERNYVTNKKELQFRWFFFSGPPSLCHNKFNQTRALTALLMHHSSTRKSWKVATRTFL